ncbi:MAG TPA: response regulator transcription factor [Solirubrobacteraceae bacterium]|jgi:DNA-binding NarL/FixJ family response regulator
MLARRRARSAKAAVPLVDDAPRCRRVVRELLERRGYAIAGEASCAASAIDSVERLAPAAALVDIHLPDATGFEVAARLTEAHPELAVLLTSFDFDRQFYALADVSGARGFVPKDQLALVEFAFFWPGIDGG